MNDVLTARITARIASIQNRICDDEFISNLHDLMGKPKFETENEWQRFVDVSLQRVWHRIGMTARLSVYLTALKAYYEISEKSYVPSTPPYHGQIASTVKPRREVDQSPNS